MNNRPAARADIIVMLDTVQEHALRNHFTIILGFCDAMALDFGPADQASADIEEIRKAASAALKVIEEARVP